MFQEHPKAVYQGGDIDAEMRIAMTADDEAALKAEGYLPHGTQVEEPEAPKRRGRPAKS